MRLALTQSPLLPPCVSPKLLCSQCNSHPPPARLLQTSLDSCCTCLKAWTTSWSLERDLPLARPCFLLGGKEAAARVWTAGWVIKLARRVHASEGCTTTVRERLLLACMLEMLSSKLWTKSRGRYMYLATSNMGSYSEVKVWMTWNRYHARKTHFGSEFWSWG